MISILRSKDDRKMTLLQIRITVVHHLLGESFPLETPMVQLHPDESFHHLELIPANRTKSTPTRKCRVCIQNLVRKETRHACIGCPENPPTHVKDCFKEYHIMK